MANVFDVAKYILEQTGSLTTMKLQKLVYYSQAWHATWDDKRLFPERIEAWINGPICPSLFFPFQGRFEISKIDIEDGNSTNLTKDEKESIDSVIHYYGDKNSQWLSDLTHAEEPWRKAREGLAPNERGNQEITIGSMTNYYANIPSE
ncbi:Panacea domain-containing protein [Legionella sp. WA2024007413]